MTEQTVRARVIKASVSATTNQIYKDDFANAYGDIIEPPYNLKELKLIGEYSSILQQCVDAYKTNIVGFGVEAEHKMDINSDEIKEAVKEKAEIILGNWTSDFYLQVLYVDPAASNSNDSSIVIKTGYKEVDFLLMGDVGTNIENYLIRTYDDISADILKAGHHGSNTSSSAAFLNAVKPVSTILSYGEGNAYGHPHSDVVARLGTIGSKLYSTAQSGDITITTDGVKHTVSAAPWVAPTPEPKPDPKPEPPPGLEVIPGAPTKLKNCTEMRKYYPKGVYRGHPAYEKNMTVITMDGRVKHEKIHARSIF